MEKLPVLLDTDIGSDIDDAVALAYLLRQPCCELLGITTVSGEPDRRAMLADAICRAAGRDDIPIHVGTAAPLVSDQRQQSATQSEALTAEWPCRRFEPENTAIPFLRDTIRSRSGVITLLTIGPLTNIALLFALYPDLPGKLKQVVMMGGRYFAPTLNGSVAEWNILCDPHAAARVFQTPALAITAVGLDVTEPCGLDADDCRRRFAAAGGPLRPVADMAEIWFRTASRITFHDPLAAALVFDESLCSYTSCHVGVDIHSVCAIGQTLSAHDGELLPHRVAATVDPVAFFEHFFRIVDPTP